eukprot:gb/GECG01005757.1/.p1 GENE.gb/GECG01005757.1/~~gb/GECG01005757.1/.p1  ORF type:complete len:247 (+),score=23.45 gb/GECG01005757.1/:1-741(+)
MRSKRRGIAHNALPQKGMQAKGHGSLHYLRTSRMCRLIVYKGRNKQYAVTLSDLVVRPSHSIIKQSFGCTERLTGGVVPPHLNGDGFGIGWYCDPDDSESTYDYIQQVPSVGRDSRAASNLEGGDRQGEHHGKTAPTQLLRSETPGVYTSITPAWNNPNLVRLSEKIRSPLVFAHVRAASLGSPVTELNCHPFGKGSTACPDYLTEKIYVCLSYDYLLILLSEQHLEDTCGCIMGSLHALAKYEEK